MRPWFFHFGPLFVPTEAREELDAIAAANTAEEYLIKIWKARGEAKPQQTQSLCNWPVAFGPQEAAPPQSASQNVTQIKKGAKA